MHNMDAIRSGMFKVVGRMITGRSINGGPGFPFFSPVLYRHLVTPTSKVDLVLSGVRKDNVVDWNVIEAVEKISHMQVLNTY